LYNVRLGFDPENVMAMSLWLLRPTIQPRIFMDCDQEARFIREILRRGRSLPGVTEVAPVLKNRFL